MKLTINILYWWRDIWKKWRCTIASCKSKLVFFTLCTKLWKPYLTKYVFGANSMFKMNLNHTCCLAGILLCTIPQKVCTHSPLFMCCNLLDLTLRDCCDSAVFKCQKTWLLLLCLVVGVNMNYFLFLFIQWLLENCTVNTMSWFRSTDWWRKNTRREIEGLFLHARWLQLGRT